MGDSPLHATTAPTSATTSGRFDGPPMPLLRLCLRNALLCLATLLVYRFWATTHLRRYFWGNARIADEHLEYTGTGGELFRGFLAASLLVAVVLAGVRLLDLALVSAGAGHSAALVLLAGVLLYSLYLAAIHRAWRYRLSRTSFRGIPWQMIGSTKEFVISGWMYTVVVVLTLGLAWPYMKVGLTRQIVDTTWLGKDKVGCCATGSGLLGPWLKFLLTIAACVGASILVPFGAIPAALVAFYAYIRYRVFETCYLVESISYAEARPYSRMIASTTAYVVGSYCIALLAVGWLASAWLSVASGPDLQRSGEPGVTVLYSSELDLSIGMSLTTLVIAVLIWIVVSQVLKPILLDLPLARHFLTTLTIRNSGAFARAERDAASDGRRRGEGLAEVLGAGEL